MKSRYPKKIDGGFVALGFYSAQTMVSRRKKILSQEATRGFKNWDLEKRNKIHIFYFIVLTITWKSFCQILISKTETFQNYWPHLTNWETLIKNIDLSDWKSKSDTKQHLRFFQFCSFNVISDDSVSRNDFLLWLCVILAGNEDMILLEKDMRPRWNSPNKTLTALSTIFKFIFIFIYI